MIDCPAVKLPRPRRASDNDSDVNTLASCPTTADGPRTLAARVSETPPSPVESVVSISVTRPFEKPSNVPANSSSRSTQTASR